MQRSSSCSRKTGSRDAVSVVLADVEPGESEGRGERWAWTRQSSSASATTLSVAPDLSQRGADGVAHAAASGITSHTACFRAKAGLRNMEALNIADR